MMFAFSVWGLLAAALGGDSSPYVLPEQGSPEQCLSKSLLQKGKSSQPLQVEGLVGNSSNSSLVKDIIDQVDLCLENRVSGAANDPSKLSLLTKIRYGEIYKVLMRQEIPFSALPSSWPQHSVAEANAIVMTGEEAAVTLVSHEFEEEVELWLHHLNLTNASDLQHLVESVAVYLRMCGGDNDVEELAKHVRELGSLSGWDQSDAETMALLLNIVENQCQLETMNLDILVEETGSHNSNHSCNHALGLATTAVHRARARDALRFEKLPDGSVYASSLDRDGYCSAHWKLVEKKPDHWISKSKELEAFVDCFCVAKRHERDCRRDHAAELKVVHTHVRDIVERLEGALQAVDPISLLNANLSTDTSSKGIGLGPCDTPLECEVCLGLMCLTTSTTSRRRRGKTMKSMGRNDDIFEAIGTGLGDASTCMSASCSPCMGLKPGDPITFVLEMGASADGCSSSADFMATFKVYITPQMCMGGPLGEIAGLLDMDCVEFGEVAYYPFLNMITLQINTPPVPRLPVPLVRARTELNLILGELTDAVKNHCNRHPEGSADQWNCLSTFYEARGNNQVTLKVEIGADLFFGEIWVTAAKKTFVIAEDNRDGFCRKHQEHGCNGHDQFFQLLDCDNDGKVDPYCSNIWNDASYISSADGCKEVHQRCPAAALDQCGVRDDHCTAWHEKLEYKDCDGDAYLDPVCTTSLGDGISIYRSAELCRRTDFVQCVRPIFLPMQTGGWQCPYLGLGKLTSSQCEISAKMEDYTFQSISNTYWPGGCFQSSWETTKLYYNTAVNDMRKWDATPWYQMTFYFRDTNCPSNMISQSECSAAAAQLGATYKGTKSWWNEQPGCLKASDGLVYFNTDGSGGRHGDTRPLNWHNPPFMMLCRSNDFVWVQRTLVADEGNTLAENGYANIENCQAICLATPGCQSFASCESGPRGCWMKDKAVSAWSGSTSSHDAIYTRQCKTWYRN